MSLFAGCHVVARASEGVACRGSRPRLASFGRIASHGRCANGSTERGGVKLKPRLTVNAPAQESGAQSGSRHTSSKDEVEEMECSVLLLLAL